MVNGAMVSKNQRLLCEMVGGELNGERVGRFTIDIVLRKEGVKIAIEYDIWFYHSAYNERDRRKDEALLHDDWRILRVRTADSLPTQLQLNEAIARLMEGELYSDIVLDDWGVGPTAPWLGRNENDAPTEKEPEEGDSE
jgi:very-short-patch-repair endonuclease